MSTIQSDHGIAVSTETFRVPKSNGGFQSWCGLCAACFFLAETNGVTMPFVNTYLVDCGWSYDSIGIVVSLATLVSWIGQFPVGLIIEVVPRHHRFLLASASILAGVCVGLLPVATASQLAVGILLMTASVGKSIFGPLTNALTVQLVDHRDMGRAVGIRQCWNHAGNIAAALIAMALVHRFSVGYLFVAVAAVSILAAGSLLLIASNDLKEQTEKAMNIQTIPLLGVDGVFHINGVRSLILATTLFHLANAPVMPLVAQKIRSVGGSNEQVAAVVLVAQTVMIPVAIGAGLLGAVYGHKRILSIGFLILPIRIALYSITDQPWLLVALQAFDGIGAGIFDVAAVTLCLDMTHGQGRFNTMMGALGTAIGLGGVVGPLLSGYILQFCGFTAAFGVFSLIAAIAAVVLVCAMPDPHRPQVSTIDEQRVSTAPQCG